MRQAVILGCTDRSMLWRHGGIAKEDYEQLVEDYAQFCYRRFDNVIVVPDDGVYTDIARRFGELAGKKALAYYPDQDTFYGIEHIRDNFAYYDTRPIGGDWYTLNAELTTQSPTIISVGFSPGVMIEGSYIKYHQKYGAKKSPELSRIHWFIDERCISNRLHPEMEEQINNLHYYSSLEELDGLLTARGQSNETDGY